MSCVSDTVSNMFATESLYEEYIDLSCHRGSLPSPMIIDHVYLPRGGIYGGFHNCAKFLGERDRNFPRVKTTVFGVLYWMNVNFRFFDVIYYTHIKYRPLLLRHSSGKGIAEHVRSLKHSAHG